MKFLLKGIGFSVGIIVAILIAAIFVASIYFDPNDHKDKVAAALQEGVGRPVAIKGDIGLTVFPKLAIECGVIEVANAPGLPGELFARLERVEIGLELLPFLLKRLAIDTFRIQGLRLYLSKDREGRTNWEDLVSRFAAPGTRGEHSMGGPPGDMGGERGAPPPLPPMKVTGGLEIRDSALYWSNARAGRDYGLEGLAIRTGPIDAHTFLPERAALDNPVDFTVSFDLNGKKPAVHGHVDASGKFSADFTAGVYRTSNFAMTGRFEGASFPTHKTAVELHGDILVDSARRVLQIKDLKLAAGRIDAKGEMIVEQSLDKPLFMEELQPERFHGARLLADLAHYTGNRQTGGEPIAIQPVTGTAARGLALDSDPFDLLMIDSVREELGLTSTQIHRLDEIYRRFREKGCMSIPNSSEGDRHPSRQQQMEIGKAIRDVRKEVAQILHTNQSIRLRELSLQLFGWSALLDPEMMNTFDVILGLNDEQKRAFEGLGQQVRRRMEGISPDGREKDRHRMKRFMDEISQKVWGLLSKEQRLTLGKMTGKQFVFKEPPSPPFEGCQ